MATDKKINELPVITSVNAPDVSILVHNGTDYQYNFAALLDFINSGINTGATFSFGNTLPQNNIGKNGDVFIKTTTGQFAQKISGTWLIVYSLPETGDPADGTVLYGLGIPGTTNGKNGDTYINVGSGIFYKKAAGIWNQVFSMQTGPQGAKGDKGDQGNAGVNGKTILNGTVNPSNLATGSNGDFYINTNTYRLFGPKTNGVWGVGISIIQRSSDERYQANTSTPTLSDWQNADAAFYGNFPRVKLLIEDDDGNEIEAQGISAKYIMDRSDPDNPLVTEIWWDLAQETNCRILIN